MIRGAGLEQEIGLGFLTFISFVKSEILPLISFFSVDSFELKDSDVIVVAAMVAVVVVTAVVVAVVTAAVVAAVEVAAVVEVVKADAVVAMAVVVAVVVAVAVEGFGWIFVFLVIRLGDS